MIFDCSFVLFNDCLAQKAHELHASWFNVGMSTTKRIGSSQRDKGLLIENENQQHTSRDKEAVSESRSPQIEQEGNTCCRCLNAVAEVRFLPCQHKITCESKTVIHILSMNKNIFLTDIINDIFLC